MVEMREELRSKKSGHSRCDHSPILEKEPFLENISLLREWFLQRKETSPGEKLSLPTPFGSQSYVAADKSRSSHFLLYPFYGGLPHSTVFSQSPYRKSHQALGRPWLLQPRSQSP